MKLLNMHTGTLPWIFAVLLAGCHPAQLAPLEEKGATEVSDPSDEARGIAEADLGKQAEILARGDLAQTGREELLVVNRFSKGNPTGGGNASSSVVFVTRAAILEKNNGKWFEILRCDEHLKNPNGYLGGSPVGRVSGWELEYSQDAKKGLELRFTPADLETEANIPRSGGPARQTVLVHWNTKMKRYQSLDRSHERYLNEALTLEPAESILR